jgi:hypothetical protein
MTFLWSILSSIITSFITALVFNFFLHRITDNAKKIWMTQHHQQIIEYLSSPNAVATVQLPNGKDQLYEVNLGPPDYRIAGGIRDKQLEAFDEMVEQKIVLPINERQYRLSHNFKEKYRKHVITLAYEEFGIKSIAGCIQKLFYVLNGGNPVGS